MKATDEILIRLLALTDAVWLPCRQWNGSAQSNRYLARCDYARTGVPWGSGRSTAAGWKAAERALSELGSKGLLSVSRPRGAKALYAKLTEAGEVRAREMTGLPGLCAAWWAVLELSKHAKRPGDARLLTDVWVTEIALGEVQYGEPTCRAELMLAENMLLPALIRQHVESNSDVQGHVCYRLTPAGWAWLDAGEPAADDDRAEPDARELYDEHIKAEIHRLDTIAANKREIGMIPLPVSMVGGELPK